MKEAEKPMTEQESLALITSMINRAKDVNHSTGLTSIMWGLVIITCSLVRLAEIHYDFRMPFDIYLLTIVAVIPQIYFSIKEKKGRKVKTYDDGFMDSLWLGFGICIFLMIYTTNIMYSQWGPAADEYRKLTGTAFPFKLYEFNSSFFLMLYGLPTFVTGVSMKFKPMLWGGLLCWVSCLVTIYTPVKTDLILVALSSIFAWLVPGIIMEKDYRKAKRELTAAHV